MRSTCWYLHCVELLHSGGGHKPFKYCIFYNQTFQLKNMPYQKESHIEASAKVNGKEIVPNLSFIDAYCDCTKLVRIF